MKKTTVLLVVGFLGWFFHFFTPVHPKIPVGIVPQHWNTIVARTAN